MGNIRQLNIKNAAVRLIEAYPDQFKANDFQYNKQKVQNYLEVKSKILRNRIAGYVTRRLATQKSKSSRPSQDFLS